MGLFTRENGSEIRRMDVVFSNGRTDQGMKDSGLEIKIKGSVG